MTRLGVGLFTFRSFHESWSEILERIEAIGYDGVEFVDRVHRDVDTETLVETLDETGLEPLGVHVWLHQLEDDMSKLIERYEPLGIDTFVVPYHPETNFRTERRMRDLVERLHRVGERLQDHGFNLLYHPNHWDLVPLVDGPMLGELPSLRFTDKSNHITQDIEFESQKQRDGVRTFLWDWLRRIENAALKQRNSAVDRALMASGIVRDNEPRTLLEGTPLGYLLAVTDPDKLAFQIDVSFLEQQGYDPAAVLATISDRVASVHAKDVDVTGYTPGSWPEFVDPGDGHVDFDGVVEVAERNDIEWVIFENGHADDPVRSVQAGMRALRTPSPRA